ncbi:MAG TPA: IPT/TIG domain-containing protein, partial [Candidatus Sulfopaludibacter sp.]|nr:IPT/TIG domain-containing protein [Candidatus Sulfopaludibacter sp.]
TAISVRLNGPSGVAADSAGNVYLTEGSIGSGSGLANGDFRVWKISAAGVFTTAAGNGLASYSGDGATAAAAQLNAAGGVAVDPAGNVYLADTLNHRVRKIAPSGVITTVAGTGVAGYSGDGGSAANAQINGPVGVAADAFGDVFIADTGNNRIRKVTNTGIIYTVAGNGNAGFFGDGGLGPFAALHAPQGVAVDAAGNIYIADTANQRVRMATPTLTIQTIAGSGLAGFSGDGAPAINAQLNSPAAVALDSAGNVYIADRDNGRIRMVNSAGVISTFAGGGSANGIGDGGPAAAAQLASPQGLAVNGAGALFISDTGHNRIREVFPNGAIITLAGTGTCCYSGDGGPAAAAEIDAPLSLALDSAGNLYLADSGNSAVRAIQQANITPSITAVVNAASELPGPVSPGEVVVIYGTGLGPAQLVSAQLNSAGLVDTQLEGVTVTFGGIPAPLVYVSNSQVSAVVPYGVSGSSVPVVVQYQNQAPTNSVTVAAASPALFTVDSSGRGQALALNQDGFPNTAAHGAQTASLITLYATGAGQTSPAGVDGQLAGAVLPQPLLPVAVTIGGQPATVLFAAGVPGSVAGIVQIVLQVPTGIQPGVAVPVTLQAGSFTSQAGVTISIAGN